MIFRAFLLILFFCPQVFAATDWQLSKSKKSKGRIIFSHDQVSDAQYSEGQYSEGQYLEAQNTLLAGIEIQLQPGWHTYWKNPGEIGLAPKSKWSLENNWTAGPILYPTPEKHSVSGKSTLTSFGYSNNVVYLTELRGSQDLKGTLEFNYLVCETLCVPEKLIFNLKLKVGKASEAQRQSSEFERLKKLKAKLPATSLAADLKWLSSKEVSISNLEANDEVFVFSPEKSGIFWTLEPTENKKVLRLHKEFSKLEILVKKPESSLSGELTQTPASASSDSAATEVSFFLALLFAFIGGIILNLMPCVLPVLMLKAHSLVLSSKKAHGTLLATSLGIISSFVLVGVLTGLLRQAGLQIGWGFQFQIPGFLVIINLILFLFALNLFGLFEINLPNRLNQKFSNGGPFLEGVFATILATPCSAPFLGTALTYALTQGWPSLLLFFFMMGLGLATPYLLFLVNPSWVRFLPKPGRWMDRMKRILAYVLLATMLWLTYVLQQQVATSFISIFLVGVFAVFIVIKEFKTWGRILGIAIIASGLTYASSSEAFSNHAISTSAEALFTESDLEERLAKGEKIFLYITADWCLTCKFNEVNVINTKGFKALLKDNNFSLMKVDWTKRDAAVAAFLEKNGRVGIPFAGAFTSERISLLPELLTFEDVKKALLVPRR